MFLELLEISWTGLSLAPSPTHGWAWHAQGVITWIHWMLIIRAQRLSGTNVSVFPGFEVQILVLISWTLWPADLGQESLAQVLELGVCFQCGMFVPLPRNGPPVYLFQDKSWKRYSPWCLQHLAHTALHRVGAQEDLIKWNHLITRD